MTYLHFCLAEEKNKRVGYIAEGCKKGRLIYYSSFISLVLVSGGVMFGTSKLCVLPKSCDAKRNRCCFNLEPDLSKHEYIIFSIPHPSARNVFLQCFCILGSLFTGDSNVSCQALHKNR